MGPISSLSPSGCWKKPHSQTGRLCGNGEPRLTPCSKIRNTDFLSLTSSLSEASPINARDVHDGDYLGSLVLLPSLPGHAEKLTPA